jgi:hypothetical protein
MLTDAAAERQIWNCDGNLVVRVLTNQNCVVATILIPMGAAACLRVQL